MKILGATCEKCVHQEAAQQGDRKATLQCVKCIRNNDRPGFYPKSNVFMVQVETVQGPMRRVING